MKRDMHRYLRKFKTFFNVIKYRILESRYKGVSYLFLPKNSTTLLISFSALPANNIRVYNNVNGFSNLNVDRLYIKDSWGYRGSYYYYERGEQKPFLKCCALIEKILSERHYSRIITAGTSKGGSCAIIFGLKYQASDIFAGACQYHIGDFLSVPCHKQILDSMIGKNMDRESFINELNSILPQSIIKYKKTQSTVHLIYSKKDKTYQDHLVDLIAELKRNGINTLEYECDYVEHNDVGYHFIPIVNEWFKNNI